MTSARLSAPLLTRRTSVAGVAAAALGALLLSLAPASAGADQGGGNVDCPSGTASFKIEPVRAGSYTEAGRTVTLADVLASTFSWTASEPVHTLIVKGGSVGAIVSTPGAESGTGVTAVSPSGNGLAGLSNVTFCFGALAPAGTQTTSPSPSSSASESPSPSPSSSASASPSVSASASASASSSTSTSPSSSAWASPVVEESLQPASSTSIASPPPTATQAAAPAGSPVSGATQAPATGVSDVDAEAVAPTTPAVDGASPITGSTAAPPTGGTLSVAVVADGAAAPAALPVTGIAGSALLALGLLLLLFGGAVSAAGRRRPAHAVPGFWSR